MGSQKIGFTGTALQMTERGIERRSESGVDETVDTYVGSWDDRATAITNLGISYGDAHAVNSDCKLREINVHQVTGGGAYAEFEYVYRPDVSGGADTPPTGTITQEANANAINVPIGQHPSASPGVNYDVDRQVGKDDWEGIKSFLEPQPTYRRTEIKDSFTFSEANIIGNCGKVQQTPTGMTSVAAAPAIGARWLVCGHSVKQMGTKYEEVYEWQYAKNGWHTQGASAIYTEIS